MSDIITVLNEICIQDENRKIIAFNMRYGLYEYFVMLFDLYNTSKTLQFYTTRRFKNLKTIFALYTQIIYIIYGKKKFAYIKHVQQVLSKLRIAQLFLNIYKYDFLIYKVKYFMLIISITGFKIDYSKVDIIQKQKISYYVKNIQSFLKFANFY